MRFLQLAPNTTILIMLLATGLVQMVAFQRPAQAQPAAGKPGRQGARILAPKRVKTKGFVNKALRDISRRVTRGQPATVVFDVDNTLVDTRRRTQAAGREFSRKEAAPPLKRLALRRVGFDGQETAVNAGLDPRLARRFGRFWDRFFWNPANFVHDRPIAATVKLAQQAKASGAEVFYVTGRVSTLKQGTIDQLKRLGLPDADANHVVCKPSLRHRTGTFKLKAVQQMLRSRGPISWFATDSFQDIVPLQAHTDVPCILVDFPVGPKAPAGSLKPDTPVIRVR